MRKSDNSRLSPEMESLFSLEDQLQTLLVLIWGVKEDPEDSV